jgi:hypothetical protein
MTPKFSLNLSLAWYARFIIFTSRYHQSIWLPDISNDPPWRHERINSSLKNGLMRKFLESDPC